ncbi:MAG: hypothetical protein KAI66_01995 [Lentisphaeria bacterium]|nr:hypothetical protein [Lentisphaeria bacterium]
MTRIQALAGVAAACCMTLAAIAGDKEMDGFRCRFDGTLADEAGTVPVKADNVRFTEGLDGRAVLIERPAALSYPAAPLHPEAFTISLRVRHEKALSDYFYRRLVYFHHETPNMKNRIGIQKRAGSNSFVFFISDAKGSAKGKNFGGDWFSMATGPLQWQPGTWHEIVCTADKGMGMAQFFIDGVKVAQAKGTQFPETFGEVFWVGSEQGHSWMRGAIDELKIEPVSHLTDAPVAPVAKREPIPPAPRILGKSVLELTGKELTTNLDFFDICIGTDTWDLRDSDAEMDRLMALCAHFGHDRVFFRVSVCGAACYHTKVMSPAYENVFTKYEGRDMIDGCCASIPSEIPRMAAVMRQIDPLASCAKYARKHRMRCYAWVTSFDSLYYATEEEFFQKHPEYTWVSRDGKKHVPGVPCYAYPEVRKYRLDQVRELCEYDIEGIIFSPRSHSPWPGRGSGGGNEGARGYGFNKPVIEAYKRKYGKDPRESKPDTLDEMRFVQLKADFFTQFLREAKEIASAAGKKIVMMTSESIADPIQASWMYVDADTLAREGIVDELCIMGSPAADLNHWRLLSDDKVRVTTWGGIHGKTYEKCLGGMRSGFRALLDNPTSAGSTYHELANLIYPDCWEEAILDTLREWQKSTDKP